MTTPDPALSTSADVEAVLRGIFGVGGHRDPCVFPDKPCACGLAEFRDAAHAYLAAALSTPLTEGTTVTEWLVDCPDHSTHRPTDEHPARYSIASTCPNARLLRREATRYPDRVTEWTEVTE